MKNIFFVLPAVLLVAAGCSSNVNNPVSLGSGVTPANNNIAINAAPAPSETGNGTATNATAAPSDETTETAAQAQKLSDQPYASYAYLISGDTLSADAKTALTGFDMTKKTLADGTMQIDLKAQKSEYKSQQYILKPGQQLYFIEKFLADDQENQEKNLHDDQAVVVDAQGNVVGAPGVFVQ